MHLLRLLPGGLPGGSNLLAEGLFAQRPDSRRNDLRQGETPLPRWREPRHPEMETQGGGSGRAGIISGEFVNALLMKFQILNPKSHISSKLQIPRGAST